MLDLKLHRLDPDSLPRIVRSIYQIRLAVRVHEGHEPLWIFLVQLSVALECRGAVSGSPRGPLIWSGMITMALGMTFHESR